VLGDGLACVCAAACSTLLLLAVEWMVKSQERALNEESSCKLGKTAVSGRWQAKGSRTEHTEHTRHTRLFSLSCRPPTRAYSLVYHTAMMQGGDCESVNQASTQAGKTISMTRLPSSATLPTLHPRQVLHPRLVSISSQPASQLRHVSRFHAAIILCLKPRIDSQTSCLLHRLYSRTQSSTADTV
jgi:hypothetical protein